MGYREEGGKVSYQYVYGNSGSPIPGSKLIRSYCQSCGEPIRVPYPEPNQPIGTGPCIKCRANFHQGCGKSSGDTHTLKYGDPSPFEENAIRDMEDNI
jgi:hypothetical protein